MIIIIVVGGQSRQEQRPGGKACGGSAWGGGWEVTSRHTATSENLVTGGILSLHLQGSALLLSLFTAHFLEARV